MFDLVNVCSAFVVVVVVVMLLLRSNQSVSQSVSSGQWLLNRPISI